MAITSKEKAKSTKKSSVKKAGGGKGEGKVIPKASAGRPLSPFDEFERMYDQFFPRGWLRPLHRDWPSLGDLFERFEGRVPRVDVIERENEVALRAEIPGIDKENLEVTMSDDAVTIKGTTRREETKEEGDYYRSEISSGSFTRTVGLPCEVDGANTTASFKNGVLELTMPKVQPSKRRTIKVE